MELLAHIATVKAQEYIIAVVFLLAFPFFWRLLFAPAPAPVPIADVARKTVAAIGDLVGGFLLPEKLFYHQGHAWVRVDDGSVVSVGIDDFAQKLVGRIDSVELPTVGSTLKQGERGWTLHVDNKPIEMLSPIEGKVVAVNEEVINSASEHLNQDPYGKGWLMKVETPGLSSNLTNLLSGELAKKWIEKVRENLSSMTEPNLGLVFQDGGLPVEGMARNLDQDRWDEIAREFLLTSKKEPTS